MTVRESVIHQYQSIVNRAAQKMSDLPVLLPAEGWIATLRKAIGMTRPQLASRLGVTRARISQLERSEPNGSVTLKTMDTAARAMGGRFVYAIIPESSLGTVIEARARKKAEAILAKASTHMALEDQALTSAQNEAAIEKLTAELLRDMPSDLWRDTD